MVSGTLAPLYKPARQASEPARQASEPASQASEPASKPVDGQMGKRTENLILLPRYSPTTNRKLYKARQGYR